jgi:hypothetical protein
MRDDSFAVREQVPRTTVGLGTGWGLHLQQTGSDNLLVVMMRRPASKVVNRPGLPGGSDP